MFRTPKEADFPELFPEVTYTDCEICGRPDCVEFAEGLCFQCADEIYGERPWESN
jgi:hypothetical protein